MDRRTIRGAGAVGGVSGWLVVLVNAPSSWYGVPVTDSYVFDPPTFSPLWVERNVVPALAILAMAGVLVGLAGLVLRDRPVAGRARRWGGVAALLGLGVTAIGIGAFLIVSPGSVGAGDAIGVLVTIVVTGLGLLIGLPGLFVMGIGYARTGRPLVGYAFGLLPVGVGVIQYINPGTAGALPGMLPIGAAWTVLAVELWNHPEPLGADEPS